jgi:hypothetical protein
LANVGHILPPAIAMEQKWESAEINPALTTLTRMQAVFVCKWEVLPGPSKRAKGSERVLKISQAVLRRGGAAGFVAPQSKIHEGYSPWSSQNR